jgi:hypothetical protein
MDQEQVQQVTRSIGRTCMDCHQHMDQEQVQQVNRSGDRDCIRTGTCTWTMIQVQQVIESETAWTGTSTWIRNMSSR